jgi:pyridoxine 5-phosphate synthase
MTQLSVNVNKIATLRNSRGGEIPSVTHFCEIILNAGAHGITIHPREDERHITKADVFAIKDFLISYNKSKNKQIEFNMEGEPSARFLDLVSEAKPDQVTLVPVRPGEITSDHGFNLLNASERKALEPILSKCKKQNFRVSLFMEADTSSYKIAKEMGTDRIELYTGPFAQAFDESQEKGAESYREYELSALEAHRLGLGINAGHDLDTKNLSIFSRLPFLEEVSIGHRLVSQALEDGMEKTIKSYLKVLSKEN